MYQLKGLFEREHGVHVAEEQDRRPAVTAGGGAEQQVIAEFRLPHRLQVQAGGLQAGGEPGPDRVHPLLAPGRAGLEDQIPEQAEHPVFLPAAELVDPLPHDLPIC